MLVMGTKYASHLIGTNGFHVKQKMKDLLLRALVVRTSKIKISRCHLADYVKKLAPMGVPHVQHDSVSSFNQSNQWFMTLSSLLSSSFRKLPIHSEVAWSSLHNCEDSFEDFYYTESYYSPFYFLSDQTDCMSGQTLEKIFAGLRWWFQEIWKKIRVLRKGVEPITFQFLVSELYHALS